MPARRLVILATILGMVSAPARACGLSWEKPHTHFDGTDEQGHVLFVDSLGDLTLGDGLKFPIFAMFNSNWKSSSPYLGQGWMLPLLESKIVQIDDNTFQLWQPDGSYQFMGRNKPTDTILNGQGGWKAEINGDTITAWASCGWKLTYNQGKLTSITTPQNRTLDLVYNNGRVTAMQENGATVLAVQTDSQSGKVTGLTFNDKTIGIEQTDKPVIQQIGGKNMVGSMAPSLSKLTLPDRTSKSYNYKATGNLEPTLTVDGQRHLSWDPVTSLIKTDGEWTYGLKPIEGSSDVAFTRTNVQGQSEAYEDNSATGVIIQKTLDGTETKTYRFTSGILAGKIRKIEEVKNDTSTVVLKNSYDETGHLIRKEQGAFDVYYSKDHILEKITKNSMPFMQAIFDENGGIKSVTYF